MRLLDIFCGAGGCSVGYHRAGFDVVGVDINPQPHYPFEFHKADALEFLAEHGGEYDVIHASPPCQAYTCAKSIHGRSYPDLLPIVRDALKKTGVVYVIENVPGSPMENYVTLCGTMFGLRVIRHRQFETSLGYIFPPGACNHVGRASGNSARINGKRVTPNLKNFAYITVFGHDFILGDARGAMDIDWMGQKEISQAIPPAYTEWIGKQILKVLEEAKNG